MSYRLQDAALRARGLSPTQKFVLVALASFADDDGLAWPSASGLAEITGYSERAVRKALADLKRLGFVADVQASRGGRARTNVVRVCIDNPESDSETVKEVHGLRSKNPESDSETMNLVQGCKDRNPESDSGNPESRSKNPESDSENPESDSPEPINNRSIIGHEPIIEGGARATRSLSQQQHERAEATAIQKTADLPLETGEVAQPPLPITAAALAAGETTESGRALPARVREGLVGLDAKAREEKARKERRRGCRFADSEWGGVVPPEWIEWAVRRGLTEAQAREEAERFADYWAAAPGQRGVKLDWAATWRNWVRKGLELRRPPALPMSGGRVFEHSPLMAAANEFHRLAEERFPALPKAVRQKLVRLAIDRHASFVRDPALMVAKLLSVAEKLAAFVTGAGRPPDEWAAMAIDRLARRGGKWWPDDDAWEDALSEINREWQRERARQEAAAAAGTAQVLPFRR